MYNPIDYNLSRINQSKKRLKILTVPTHEGYQTLLGNTDHDFYMLQGQGIKQWDFHTRPLPKNHYLLTKPVEQGYPAGLEFDLLFSQERYGGLQRFLDIGKKLDVPVLHLDHTMPPPNMGQRQIDDLAKLRANTHVYITEFSKNAWGGSKDDLVINHGIDTNVFKGYHGNEQQGISIVNYFPQRDVFCGWNLWQKITQEVPVKLIGENPGLSESISDVNTLVETMSRCRFFLNTSQWSPVPLSLLEAMAIGMPIVTTAKQEIPKIIQHGYNGFLIENEDDAIKYCKVLMEDLELAKKLGSNARKTIETNFNIQTLVNNWNNIFLKTYEDYR